MHHAFGVSSGPVILSLACMAAIADSVIRTAACDVPSLFCLHMNGQGPPTFRFRLQPFGFDIGLFAEYSAFMKFSAPDLCTTRTRVLDYFYAQRLTVENPNLIFDWERSLEPGNFTKVIDQLCWDVGFPNTPQLLPRYISCEDPIINENYPEIAYYRDIIFYFKFMMLAPHDALPEPKAWMPIDAKLVWKYNGVGTGYSIHGFNQTLKFTVDDKLDEKKELAAKAKDTINTAKTGVTGFLSKLFSSRIRGRGSTDASAILGQKIDDEEGQWACPFFCFVGVRKSVRG